jgi:hypothetical protein
MAAETTASHAAMPAQQPVMHAAAPQLAIAPDGAPVNFVYLHVHNAIRSELVSLEAGVKELVSETASDALLTKLAALKERYTFLERIYKYHSSVEDEVRANEACGPHARGRSLN